MGTSLCTLCYRDKEKKDIKAAYVVENGKSIGKVTSGFLADIAV